VSHVEEHSEGENENGLRQKPRYLFSTFHPARLVPAAVYLTDLALTGSDPHAKKYKSGRQ